MTESLLQEESGMKGRRLSSLLLAVFLTACAGAGPAAAGPAMEFGESGVMELSFLGQVHYSFMEDAADDDDFFLRRARIIFTGQIVDGVRVFVETEYANAGKTGADPSLDLLDTFVDVRLFESAHWLSGGLINLPFSFENRSSASKLLGIDLNIESIKFVNDFSYRDIGFMLHGSFGKRVAYDVGVFDGYDTADGVKNSDADLRFTGHIAFNVLGEVETGWSYTQDRLGTGSYLSLGAGYDSQKDATRITPESGDSTSLVQDNRAWVVDLQSGFILGGTTHLTVNAAWYDWDNADFEGSTAFVETGLRYHKVIGTFKYGLQNPDEESSINDYTLGLHYNVRGYNLLGGIEYRWGDSSDWWLAGIQFLL
jgi:hypothetical protein